jgi:hypothetical protein
MMRIDKVGDRIYNRQNLASSETATCLGIDYLYAVAMDGTKQWRSAGQEAEASQLVTGRPLSPNFVDP